MLMARTHNEITKEILSQLHKKASLELNELYGLFENQTRKGLYDAIYRLKLQGYLDLKRSDKKTFAELTEAGKFLAIQKNPVRDGVWKLIIFDIPETKRKIRDHLRSRLMALGFKKWQTSIWASPYILNEEIEGELKELSSKLFIRLIKTTDINNTSDLEKLFEE